MINQQEAEDQIGNHSIDNTKALIDEVDMFVVTRKRVSRGLYPEHSWDPDIDCAQDIRAMLPAAMS